jgi:chitodextrinase
MTLVELAHKLRPYIEKAALSLTDADALEAIDLFGSWQADKAYVVDDKVKYEGNLYKCLQAHTS